MSSPELCKATQQRRVWGCVPTLGCCSHPRSPPREVGQAQVHCTVYGSATITKKDFLSRMFPDSTVQMGMNICLSFSDDNHIYTSWLKCFNKLLPDENTWWCWGLLIFATIQITVQMKKQQTKPIKWQLWIFLSIFRKTPGNVNSSSSQVVRWKWRMPYAVCCLSWGPGRAKPLSLSEGPVHSQASEQALLHVWLP